jgi:hypothetical protein
MTTRLQGHGGLRCAALASAAQTQQLANAGAHAHGAAPSSRSCSCSYALGCGLPGTFPDDWAGHLEFKAAIRGLRLDRGHPSSNLALRPPPRTPKPNPSDP